MRDCTQILNVELAFDLGSGLGWRKPTVRCVRLLTGIFQLKIYWAEMQSCYVRVK
jgi:hypothetical protein